MGAVPLQRAFDLTPGYELRLGPKVYPVPPLTLGRFMDLMACNWTLLVTALKAVQPPAENEALSKEPEKLAAQLGKSLAYFPIAAFGPLIAAAVPGVTEIEWKGHGSGTEFFALYRYFGATHDWRLITKAIGFGDPKAASATRATVTAALMSFCQRFPANTIESLLETRVEGFFYMRDGADELLGASEEEGNSAPPPGGAFFQDPEKKSGIWQLMDEAESRGH